MSTTARVTLVGVPDPELRNSPIIEETAEDMAELERQLPEGASGCYFNGVAFANGAMVRCGSDLLRCDSGAWVRQASADPDNPL